MHKKICTNNSSLPFILEKYQYKTGSMTRDSPAGLHGLGIRVVLRRPFYVSIDVEEQDPFDDSLRTFPATLDL